MSAQASKKTFVSVIGALSSLAGYGCFWQMRRYNEARQREVKINEEYNEFKPYNLTGAEAKYYPWMRSHKSLEQFQDRIVNVQGFFKEERFFVRRINQGLPGYLVFAPFVTAISDTQNLQASTSGPAQHIIFVNLGWIPTDNLKDYEPNAEPLPLKDVPEDEKNVVIDPQTMITNFEDHPRENHVGPVTSLTGIVRKGEKSDILRGKINHEKDGFFTYADLEYFAKISDNLGRAHDLAATTCYLERIVKELPDDSDEVEYPLPSTPSTYQKPYLNASKHLTYGTFWGAASAVGWAFTLINLIK